MKANELMVGDWVEVPFFEGKPKIVKVEEILSNEINPEWDGMENYGGIKIKYVKPIPLTPEILEKNGFKIYEQDFTSRIVYKFSSLDYMEYEEYHKYFNIGCKITYKHFGREITYIHSLMRIQYVHELQHALKLCGIEKTIEL